MWTRLYSSSSASDKGTLFQLKNVINRTAVPLNPQKNVQATEDFLEVVSVAHIVVAAETEYSDGMSIEDLCDRIVQKYVFIEPAEISECTCML